MNADEVLKLIDAGFSADEIRGMKTDEPKEPTPAPEEGAIPGAEEVKEPTPEVKALTEEITKLREQIKSFQTDNIKKAKSGTAAVDDPVQKTIDGFLKEL